MQGRWFLEAGFGRFSSQRECVFRNLPEAQQWIAERAL
jgi:phospholipid N-methyltransferase